MPLAQRPVTLLMKHFDFTAVFDLFRPRWCFVSSLCAYKITFRRCRSTHTTNLSSHVENITIHVQKITPACSDLVPGGNKPSDCAHVFFAVSRLREGAALVHDTNELINLNLCTQLQARYRRNPMEVASSSLKNMQR